MMKYESGGRKSQRIHAKSLSRFHNTVDTTICLNEEEENSEDGNEVMRFKHKKRKVSQKIVYSDTDGDPQSPESKKIKMSMKKEVSKVKLEKSNQSKKTVCLDTEVDTERPKRKKMKTRNNRVLSDAKVDTKSPKRNNIKTRGKKGRVYPTVFNRCSAKQLVKAVNCISEKQRQKVVDMGFGALMSLRIEGIPGRLGYFVADNFDVEKMEITLQFGSIKVDEDSIWRLLGIPISVDDIEGIPKNDPYHAKVVDWLEYYGQQFNPSDIVERIKANADDISFNFMVDFIMLFISTMVECQPLGKCKLDFLGYLTPEFVSKKMNWCKYVLERIKDCRRNWGKSAHSPLTGG